MRIGNHHLLQKIETDSVFEIWLAQVPLSEGASSKVILRRILPSFLENEDEKHVTKFLHEKFFAQAQLASKLFHPNLVQILDASTCDGEYFLSMEYIQGCDLGCAMRRSLELQRRLPPAVALRIVADVCAGLHYLHTWRGAQQSPLGLVHREVSMQNIWLGFDGSVKLAGFGIARPHMSSGDINIEPLLYMSPEQTQSKSALDARSDIFSLGVVLYALLTGVQPFKRGTLLECMRAVAHEEPTKPSKLAKISPQLDPLVMRALAKNPEKRYPSAKALQMSIETYLASNGLWAEASKKAVWMKELFSKSPKAQLPERKRGAPLPEEETVVVPKLSTPSKKAKFPENLELISAK